MNPNTKQSLEQTACAMLSNGNADRFRLMAMTNVISNSPKHPLRYSATIATIGNKAFTAVGSSPVDAVIKALCQEKITTQGWSAGDRRAA